MERAPTILSLRPLVKLSFSQWISIRRCPLKGSLSSAVIDGELPKPALTRASIVGKFHHRAMELVATARTPAEIRQLLEDEIEKLQREISTWPHLRRLGSVSGWDEINRSVSLAEELAGSRRDAMSANSGTGVEVELRSSSGLLVGRPDYFTIRESRGRLREYKSGAIREKDGILASEYADQVKFYSCLIFDCFDVDTVDASVESLSGDRCEVTINRTDASLFFASMEATLNALNQRIQEGVAPEMLALPSHDACSFCVGRVVCIPFKRTQDEMELDGDQHVVQGTVVSLEKRTVGQAATIEDVCRGRRLALNLPADFSQQICQGSSYVFLNLRRQGAAFSWGHTSRVLANA
jgi:hypothetical protein